ncbi:MAG: hypothetical protein LBB23_03000 [Rickettsiales bacterium]|nr:hypothetical protein [Rickettsiales bacterium]
MDEKAIKKSLGRQISASRRIIREEAEFIEMLDRLRKNPGFIKAAMELVNKEFSSDKVPLPAKQAG